jgi:hypothetical protein
VATSNATVPAFNFYRDSDPTDQSDMGPDPTAWSSKPHFYLSVRHWCLRWYCIFVRSEDVFVKSSGKLGGKILIVLSNRSDPDLNPFPQRCCESLQAFARMEIARLRSLRRYPLKGKQAISMLITVRCCGSWSERYNFFASGSGNFPVETDSVPTFQRGIFGFLKLTQ